MKAVLDVKAHSQYDDNLAHYYHFPKRYIKTIEQCVGDWVVLRQPRADHGSKAYIATAKISSIVIDKFAPANYYAFFSDFSRFDMDVAWLDPGGQYREESLRALQRRSDVGVFLRGRSARPISEHDYQLIVWQGFQGPTSLMTLTESGDCSTFQFPERRIEQILLNRKVRDAAFRLQVCSAYNWRCAISGLKIEGLTGNFEAQAAHILPVAAGGPDSLSNGIALSSTIHWLFDHHLISFSEDLETVFSPKIPARLSRLLPRRPFLPADASLRPDPRFISRHRERFLHGLSR